MSDTPPPVAATSLDEPVEALLVDIEDEEDSAPGAPKQVAASVCS